MSEKIWYALGIDDDYEIKQHYNGKAVTLNFKNVAITDNENIEKSSFVIWDRVYKETEETDTRRIKAILKAVEWL